MTSQRFEPTPNRLMPDLSPRAELAVLARALYREGYEEHIAGHISYKQPDGTPARQPVPSPLGRAAGRRTCAGSTSTATCWTASGS